MNEPKRLLEHCERLRPWLEDLVTRLVREESPTSDPDAVNRVGQLVISELSALEMRVQRVAQPSAGHHIQADRGDATAQVLLLGHLDTVWPVGELSRMPLRAAAGRLYGPGVFDMKAGLAIGICAIRALIETRLLPPHRIALLFTSDEETGSATSRSLIEAEADRSAAVLVLEPALPGGGVKTSRKGVGEYRLEARGVAAHAGIEPERGASAVLELAHQTVALAGLQDLARGITVTVGRLEGGTRSNVVPAHAAAHVDVRVTTAADAREIDRRIRDLQPAVAGVSLSITGGMNRPPMERTSGVGRLYELARTLAGELGHVLGEGGTGGASDGNFTAGRGVPTLDGLGAIGGGAHAADEHVELEPLPMRAALVAGLLLRAI
jgi:glutamate carboxypeptidase